jgi:DNA-binding NtrC family response regulator
VLFKRFLPQQKRKTSEGIVNTKETAILIVDDDADAGRLMATLLGQSLKIEHACKIAGNAQEATSLLESSFFHLVITDIQMPGISGVHLCEHISENYPNTVVVMLSGMSEIEYAIASMRAGAFDYLLKPVNIPKLMESIDRALKYQEALMAKHYCEQSLEEEIHDLLSLNKRLRTALKPRARVTEKKLAKSQKGNA